MASYILLRNNKEQGPFTKDELLSKGLKPYDLVWIEGRSAGWRYPSEIEELKAFAPVVEEQPYDRFYKKTSEQSASAKEETAVIVETVQEKPTIEQSNSSTEALTTADHQTIYPSKRIYVTIPANTNKPATKPPEEKIIVEEKKIIIEEKPKPILKQEPVQLEEKYSQPLDEIKKQYVNTVLNKKQKPLSPVFNEKIKLGAVALALLLSGTAVGLLINRKPSAEKITAATIPEQKVINTAAQIQEPIIETPKQETTPVTQKNIETEKPITSSSQQNNKTIQQDNTLNEDVTINKKPAAETRNITKRESKSEETTIKQSNSSTITSAKADNPTPSDRVIRVDLNKPNLAKKINITASNYKKATFGGISNLEFTVSNNTAYTIDMVIAEVDYYTANKKIYKTETVYFKNIAPNGSQVQQAPDSNRGYEVKYRISLISSKELGIYTAGM